VTIRKVGKKWKAEARVTGVKSRYATFERKMDALTWLEETKLEMKSLAQGEVSPKLTVADAFKRYRDTVSPHKKGARWESVRINKLLKDELANVLLKDLRPADIAEWRDRRLDEVSGSSVNRELNLISNCFKIAADEWGWLKEVPTTKVRRPKNSKPRDRRITEEEIDTITFVLGYDEGEPIIHKTQELAVAFLFAIETAMRLGEICGLKWDHIDGNVARLCDTKNGHSRNVPLSKRAIQLLEMMKDKNGSQVFNLKSDPASSLFRKYRKKAQIEDLVFHDTRHEAITRLASKLKVLDLARMTGHRDINMLQIYYNERPEEIAAKLN